MTRSDDELRRAVARIGWFHSLELRPGIITAGHSDEGRVLPYMRIPDDLTGLSVLDIGCWDGFYSFECERRGAARVVSCDIWEAAGRAGFDLAREELESKAEPLECSVYDLDPEVHGRFDVVLFIGVLYHLRHPLLALEKVAAVTTPGGLAIIETVVDTGTLDGPPSMAFFPGRELNHDPTNWWAPNLRCLAGMLDTCGFTANNDIRLYAVNRTIFRAWKMTDEQVAARDARDRRLRHNRMRPW